MTRISESVHGRSLTIFIAHPSRFLTDHRPNGDGLIAFGFIRELAIRGHELHVAVDGVDLCQPLPKNVHIHQLLLRMPPGPLRHVEYMLRVRTLLRRLQRSAEVDLIHQLNPVTTGLSLAFLGMRLPIVLGTYVGTWPQPASQTALGALLASLRSFSRQAIAFAQQSSADLLLVTGEAALRDRIVVRASRRQKVVFQKHGVDIATFKPPPDRRRSHARQKILFVASLTRKKGIYVLIDALKKVLLQCPAASLVVAGGGVEFARLQEYVDRLDLSSVITFVGTVNRSDIANLMRDSAVFCLPSLGEPYATSVIEALSSGLPIVVTDSGGAHEIVDARGGTKVRSGDADDLAAAIVEILQNPDEAVRMSEHNRLRAEREFSWSRVCDSLEEAYHTAMKGSVRNPQSQ